MPAPETPMSDVVVIADACVGSCLDDLATQLKSAGLAIDSIDRDNGVIEGTVETSKVKSLQGIPNVKYVRSVFNYESEKPDDDLEGEEIPR